MAAGNRYQQESQALIEQAQEKGTTRTNKLTNTYTHTNFLGGFYALKAPCEGICVGHKLFLGDPTLISLYAL